MDEGVSQPPDGMPLALRVPDVLSGTPSVGTPFLRLDPSLWIASGSQRDCYRHPDDPALCVKITARSHHPRRHQNPRELAYYRLLQRNGNDWLHLARCHGSVETSHGPGVVFDLLRDASGKVLPNLEERLTGASLDAGMLRSEFRALRDWLLVHRVIVGDLRLANLVFDPDRPSGHRLVLVDGVNNRNLIRLESHVAWLARRKIQRIWKRFVSRQLAPRGLADL
jgi:hypothetical protein